MIKELTKEQEKMLQVYLKDALETGTSTLPLDKEKAITSVKEIYTFLKKPEPVIQFFSSPLACQKEFQRVTGNKSYQSGWYSPLYWAGYYTTYNFIKNEVIPTEKNNFPLLDQCINWFKNLHYIQDCDNLLFISERPTKLKCNQFGLHADGEMALEYADGFGIYSLNGIRIPKEIVLTPANELDAKLIATTENAEVRREIFRKIGYENVVKKLNGKLIDKHIVEINNEKVISVFGKPINLYEYELYNVDLGKGNIHPFLKMNNPSIDAAHFEPVPKGTKTVLEALAFRNGLDKFIPPSILT